MTTVALIQARIGSVRFPNKILKKINNKTTIEILLKRLSKSKLVDKIVVASPQEDKNTDLSKEILRLGFKIFFGSKDDILDRFYKAAKSYKAKTIIRITGDCPLIDPSLVDNALDIFFKKKADYLCNNEHLPFPDGLDIEITKFALLKKAWKKATKPLDREHVTPYISRLKNINKIMLKGNKEYSKIRLTLDYKIDLIFLKKILNYFKPSIYFSFSDILKLYKLKPKIFDVNNKFIRDEGSSLSDGQKLWLRAKEIIPGGNMLLSKRSEIFLPDKWPSYFSKSKGCYVWGLDKKKFIDMSIMSVGTNILGYGNTIVDEAVKKTVIKGNMSSLNCPEEVFLAEKLVEMHPWAEMVKFARTGGEANAVAIRIARAASGKDKIAICGYHGWHDWYLAANIKNKKNLNQHLITGLNPFGVPKALKNTIFTFSYNNYSELENLVNKEKEIGVVKMEVARNFRPKNNFLKKIKKLCEEKNIVLIFDECTSGFRETYGGLHLKYNVEPDIAIFGKALGNGYAITAIIGKKKVMETAQNSFISSTFWTERIGPSAALATLKVMKKEESWKKITKIGKSVKLGWKKLASKYKLKISVSGLDPIPNFSFISEDDAYFKAFLTQEMLRKNYLAINSIFISTTHKKNVISQYFQSLDRIFKRIKAHENEKIDIKKEVKLLPYTGFGRLN